MEKIRVCLDVDGVLLNFLQTISDFIEKKYKVTSTIPFSCTQWSLKKRFDKEWIDSIGFEKIKDEFEKEGYWSILEPMPEIDKIHELINNPLFELTFVTQIPTNLHDARLKNLSTLLGQNIASDKLICVPLGESKQPHIEKIKPHYFIEDNLHHLRDCHAKHQSIWINHDENHYDETCLKDLPIKSVKNLNEAITHIQKELLNNDPQILMEKIQKVLTKDLLTPQYRKIAQSSTEGHCYAASEALYYLLGGKYNGNIPQVASFEKNGEKLTHWWIKDQNGKILDPTADQFYAANMEPPYHAGKGSGFLTKHPSKRARTIIQRLVSNELILNNEEIKPKKRMKA